MLDTVSMSEAAKWIALVFAAGFIGFFGKSLARAILSVFHKKKGGSPEPSGSLPPPRGGPPEGPEPVEKGSGKDVQKTVKKALKAQEKAMKKRRDI
ncbi:MAG TPA: hypothetical protein PLA83_11895 [Deltaproteobacteria bacterium]|jgi:hypothetical protein|nr:hypothetical protein [Deltaproteobacteria bacterium]HQJ08416.1 hypothetical protein [Deltaproteobacteria bacterium]